MEMKLSPRCDFAGIRETGAQFGWAGSRTPQASSAVTSLRWEGKSAGGGAGFWGEESQLGDRTLHFKTCLAKAILIAAFVIKD